MISLHRLLPDPPALTVIDIGAMWLGQKEITYQALIGLPGTRVIGFEPVEAECAKLNAMNRPGHTFLPMAIGDGTQRTFYLTNTSMTSSLYEPNTEFLRQFVLLDESTRVVQKIPMQTHRLDDLAQVDGCDYLKLDIQGAELDVLKGATRHLRTAALIHCEMEYAPMYKGQPLFADVDAHLRAQGYCLYNVAPPKTRIMKPFTPRVENGKPILGRGNNFAIWTEGLYIPDIMNLRTQPPERLLRTALILHHVFGAFDVAARFLLEHQIITGSTVWGAYIEALTGKPAPALPDWVK